MIQSTLDWEGQMQREYTSSPLCREEVFNWTCVQGLRYLRRIHLDPYPFSFLLPRCYEVSSSPPSCPLYHDALPYHRFKEMEPLTMNWDLWNHQPKWVLPLLTFSQVFVTGIKEFYCSYILWVFACLGCVSVCMCVCVHIYRYVEASSSVCCSGI